MIELNRKQTHSLSRLFKKVDFDLIAFNKNDNEEIIITATNTAGISLVVALNEDGRAVAVQSRGAGRPTEVERVNSVE